MPKSRAARHSRNKAGEAASTLDADLSDKEFQKAISQAEGRIRQLYAGKHPDTGESLDGNKLVSALRPGEIVAFQIFGSLRDVIEMHPDVSKLLDTYVGLLDWNCDLIGNRSIRVAEILTRIEEVAKPLGGFENYDVAAVEYARWIIRRVVNDMQADVVTTQNPIFAWWTLRMIHSARLPTPRWITNYLGVAATRISKISDEVHAGRSIGKEAERVGKALGFGIEGPGQGGWFKRLEVLERDRQIYREVDDEISNGEKRDIAYDIVAKRLRVSRSTVSRGYARIRKFGSRLASSKS